MTDQPRKRPRITSATVSQEAADGLDQIAGAFYAGKRSRAVDAAILAWITIVGHPSTHGLAGKPHEALAAFCAAHGGGGRDASQAEEVAGRDASDVDVSERERKHREKWQAAWDATQGHRDNE